MKKYLFTSLTILVFCFVGCGEHEPHGSKKAYDILEMDNSIPFNIVKWNVDYQCAIYDAWFSEKIGLITDNNSWMRGMSEEMGWYALHRFNRRQYTCNYLHTPESLGEDGYGGNIEENVAVRDMEYSTLPIKNGYYVLDLRQWQNYKPLYLPYSKEFIANTWKEGMLLFEYKE